jgi:hypothetical protein
MSEGRYKLQKLRITGTGYCWFTRNPRHATIGIILLQCWNMVAEMIPVTNSRLQVRLRLLLMRQTDDDFSYIFLQYNSNSARASLICSSLRRNATICVRFTSYTSKYQFPANQRWLHQLPRSFVVVLESARTFFRLSFLQPMGVQGGLLTQHDWHCICATQMIGWFTVRKELSRLLVKFRLLHSIIFHGRRQDTFLGFHKVCPQTYGQCLYE